MDPENETLSYLNWDNNIALPVANAENKLLEESVAHKTSDRNKFLSDLTENSSRVNALRDHIKYVRDELASAQSLLMARKKEMQTEEHLRAIADRENGRLKQENERLDTELSKLKEKRNQNEVSVPGLILLLRIEDDLNENKKKKKLENRMRSSWRISSSMR